METTITGDIVQSRAVDQPDIWLGPLKKLFKNFGDTPKDWEIYRGDSFQLKVEAREALRVAILIKSIIKKIDKKKLDVRLAIGIGDDAKYANRVSEAIGEAFVYSGELLEELKEKKIHLGVKSKWPDFDKELNMMFKLALVIMNSWTSNTAEVAAILFKVPGITQVEISKKLGIAQSSVNDRIKRGSVYEIIELDQYYRDRIDTLTRNQYSYYP